MSRLEYAFTVVFLACGYAAVLVGILLPTRLVFFPMEYEPPPDEGHPDDTQMVLPVGGPREQEVPADDLHGVDHGEQLHESSSMSLTLAATMQGPATSPKNVDRDEDHLALAAATLQQEDKPRRTSEGMVYYVMPWNFVYMGTLSSVTQRADSAEGRIFTTCLIINEVCVLLSRYTVVLYDRECDKMHSGAESKNSLYLTTLQTEPFWNLVLRVLWLILPTILMLITAAIPSATYNDEDHRQGDNINDNDAELPDHGSLAASRVARSNQAAEVAALHDKRTRKYMAMERKKCYG
ncbi:unnamed protein product [Amoebophrya sp. A120]|nr:unnamed protein product [Amoebophrya sp. A120]|eukprot:GSA120T00000848001.1